MLEVALHACVKHLLCSVHLSVGISCARHAVEVTGAVWNALCNTHAHNALQAAATGFYNTLRVLTSTLSTLFS